MKILVTGAGGLIGRYLASFFADQGEEVIASYRNTLPDLITDRADNIRCLRLDLSEGMDNLESVDVVIHAAAHTHLIPDSTTEQYIRSNLVGMLNLAEYAKRTRPNILIYLSTISMFGQIEVAELDEDTPPNDPGIYGMTKYLGEQILRDHADDFPSVSIRLPGVVGPGYFTPWIGSVLTKAAWDEDIEFYNPDSLFNNIVDLEELGRFISCAVASGINDFQSINLAANEAITTREVVDTIISLTGSKSQVNARNVDRTSFVINCQKAISVFGFDPATTMSMVSRYVNANLELLGRSQALR